MFRWSGDVATVSSCQCQKREFGPGAIGGLTTTKVQDLTNRRPLLQFCERARNGAGLAYYIVLMIECGVPEY